MPGTIAALEEDAYRAIFDHVTDGLAAVADVHEANVLESSLRSSSWFVFHLISLVPESVRGEQFLARGVVRVRCRFRVRRTGAAVETRQGWRLARAVRGLLAQADLAVFDRTTSDGRFKVGVCSFEHVEAAALDPVDGIGEILCTVPFLLTGLPS